MGPAPVTPDKELLAELRRRRAELRESIVTLEHALATSLSADPARWAERVQVALVELAADVRAHVEITEGADGLYSDILRAAPRLSGAVHRLGREHEVIRRQIDDALARLGDLQGFEEGQQLREQGTDLLGDLMRHRQRGSDLVFSAYELDIGGED